MEKCFFLSFFRKTAENFVRPSTPAPSYTGELGYDGPLYGRLLSMADDMLGPSPMHINDVSYVYDGFFIGRTNFPGPIESVISKFACTSKKPSATFALHPW